jgi:hypothetical protein
MGAAGTIRYGQIPGAIGVLDAPDQPMPIGMASRIGRTEGGLAVWQLAIHGADVPGRWVIVDRELGRGPEARTACRCRHGYRKYAEYDDVQRFATESRRRRVVALAHFPLLN